MGKFKTRKYAYHLTENERVLLDSLSESNKETGWLARNPKGNLTIYLEEPYKTTDGVWVCNNYSKGFPFAHYFNFVTDKPIKISELLNNSNYEAKGHFTPKMGEEYWSMSQSTEGNKRQVARYVFTGTKTDMFNLTNDMCYPTYGECKNNADHCHKVMDDIIKEHWEATK